MNRHFGKTLATQDSHIHQTTISFTYTSNHHKLHIYIKPPQASHIHFTYTSNHHKLHIYTPHIHQTTKSFTYISNPRFKYTTSPTLIKESIWVINGRKELGGGPLTLI